MISNSNYNTYNESTSSLMNAASDSNKYIKSEDFLYLFDSETIGMGEATFHSDRSNVPLPMVAKSKKTTKSFDVLYFS